MSDFVYVYWGNKNGLDKVILLASDIQYLC